MVIEKISATGTLFPKTNKTDFPTTLDVVTTGEKRLFYPDPALPAYIKTGVFIFFDDGAGKGQVVKVTGATTVTGGWNIAIDREIMAGFGGIGCPASVVHWPYSKAKIKITGDEANTLFSINHGTEIDFPTDLPAKTTADGGFEVEFSTKEPIVISVNGGNAVAYISDFI